MDGFIDLIGTMDGFIDLIAGIFNFLYICASGIVEAVVDNPSLLLIIIPVAIAWHKYWRFVDRSMKD